LNREKEGFLFFGFFFLLDRIWDLFCLASCPSDLGIYPEGLFAHSSWTVT
jgi:hypothetical protein